MDYQIKAGDLMKSVVANLVEKYPQFSNGSGHGFWPVPALFPKILSFFYLS